MVEVDKIPYEVNDSFQVEDVLLLVNGEKVIVGKPTISGAKITATVIEQKKGEKIRVMKFKAKVRYRRTMGFRPMLSILKIEKIAYSDKETTKSPKSTSKTTKK